MATLNVAPERAAELREALAEIRERVQAATPAASTSKPTLVAVSKFRPGSDIVGAYGAGQRDFGENYVTELVTKAAVLPEDIRWHFIGTFQSNKAKELSLIPNLYCVHTIDSVKRASALNKAAQEHRATPLNILLQVNTSGEDTKSGVPPLAADGDPSDDAELVKLARHVVTACPALRLQGLMTIGSLAESLGSHRDFETLVRTRDALAAALAAAGGAPWGEDGRLLLSMGMSSDFEAALAAGSDVVRVGTSIFGARPKKGAAT